MQTFWSRFLQENKEMNLNKGTNNPGEDTKKSEKKFSKRRIPVHCGHTWTITQYKGAWQHADLDNIIKKTCMLLVSYVEKDSFLDNFLNWCHDLMNLLRKRNWMIVIVLANFMKIWQVGLWVVGLCTST